MINLSKVILTDIPQSDYLIYQVSGINQSENEWVWHIYQIFVIENGRVMSALREASSSCVSLPNLHPLSLTLSESNFKEITKLLKILKAHVFILCSFMWLTVNSDIINQWQRKYLLNTEFNQSNNRKFFWHFGANVPDVFVRVCVYEKSHEFLFLFLPLLVIER